MNSLRFPAVVAFALGVFTVTSIPIRACLWDSDTLAMETSRFPGVFEMITGQFPRHSNEFYVWRIDHAKRRVMQNPRDFAAYDDWAVAEHKLGRNHAAIEVMTQALVLASERYESLPNLGTFQLFAGNLTECCELLRRALRVNPDAHFGREKYQLWLAELLLRQKTALESGRSANSGDQSPPLLGGGKLQKDLETFLKRSRLSREEGGGRSAEDAGVMSPDQRKEAVTAVLGMMRFARHDHPLLLEALGDLLMPGRYSADANQLAAFAYLRTSQVADGAADQTRLHQISKRLITSTHGSSVSFEALSARLESGLTEGSLLQAQVRADELAWIRDGKDAQVEFEKKYLK